MLLLTEEIAITEKKLKAVMNDPEKTAEAVRLRYVSDAEQGIRRVKKGNGFTYYYGNKALKDEASLQRVQKLVVPPAWEKVWICRHENGHLQATGLDLKKRKQYRYHPLWSTFRNHTKFYRLHEFGKRLPDIRRRIDEDLSRRGMPPEKVLAAVVLLMEQTSIRVGNSLYEKLYGSFGLTTLKDRHVKINGPRITFLFVGKKGVPHRISLKNKKLAAIVKRCREIPGKELFQYIDEAGERRNIDSGMVNDYIQGITGSDFTAKDFRTWNGTINALRALKNLGEPRNSTQIKKNLSVTLDYVAKQLGNTRTVCKKYYVHPLIPSLYENNRLHRYLREFADFSQCGIHDLACEEKVLMRILRKESLTL